jgi:hypothetical protein
VVNMYMRTKVPGTIRDVRFRNLAVTGQPGAYKVQVLGADEQHDVRGVTFDQVEVLGAPLGPTSDRLQVGQYVEGVHFGTKAP